MPIAGYFGISYGDYLDVFNFHLPALTVKNEDLSKEIFEWHETGAMIIVALIALHILAAIFHKFVRKDRVVDRMLPGRRVA
jgi:cytochrome b561